MYLILEKSRLSVKRFQRETVTCTTTGGSSSLVIKSTPLEEKMRIRINAVLMLAASFIVLIAVGSAKSVQTGGRQSPSVVLMDGGGPMCFPDSGCGYKNAVFVSREHLPAVLLADGTGPMCFPDSGCGHRFGMVASRDHLSAVLLADGTGPMCFPSTGCGYRNDDANMLWPS